MNSSERVLRIGVDVGGTFTDLVAVDADGKLRVAKLPSTPPHFHVAVLEAIGIALAAGGSARVVHGSTVATNALLQRAAEPVGFITTEGFRDMLLVGRQNRPDLYALRVERPAPVTGPENWFTVRERVDASGNVVTPLDDDEIGRVIGEVTRRGLRHAAVCLLFSFLQPRHERRLGEHLAAAGVTVSLSCDVVPEFREYERASTTAINAALRPTVAKYLRQLKDGLPPAVGQLSIMHSGGGTLPAHAAAASAARLVLSGPAGGVIGAAFVARAAGFDDVITYDMGGTSTDVATVLRGAPRWTTSTIVDGLPIALPMFDIHTVGAGGGSIAYLDAGGALRVGPRSAGATPGPACYGRGGAAPTVTDANLVLGRILPDAFLGGAITLDVGLARRSIEPLAAAIGTTVEQAALGMVKVAEGAMSRAIRSITARRGHDPRPMTLVTFGGAGGLHACALADALEISRVLVPPYCGVLSALGMAVAVPVVDVSQTVVHLGDQLDDARIAAECGKLNLLASEQLPNEETSSVEVYADVRFRGQSHEMRVPVRRPQMELIRAAFLQAYAAQYGRCPDGRAVELVTLRLRRTGTAPQLALPPVERSTSPVRRMQIINADGLPVDAVAIGRGDVVDRVLPGPLLLTDTEATTLVPTGWTARGRADGTVVLERFLAAAGNSRMGPSSAATATPGRTDASE